MRKLLPALLTAVSIFAMPVAASEADFLQTLAGEWSGGGQIRLKPEDGPVDVTCELSSTTSADAVSMRGTCSALIIMSREIGADLSVDGTSYSGTYTGSIHGPANLAGTRDGDTINLSVSWPESGREAAMSLSATGNSLQIVTREAHPETQEQIVTSQLSFQRQ
ncbi:hypothetical protein GTW25_05315 [Aliihoeflea aestuarii]|jgi:hypothetical protein|uniref:hypothetical protein n=1 Tax=Aliihoeflea aestuarii TaxID=453840 RepID=UPI002094013F|nr:hypothetical protein [Aliihoeflea aestuarii]MCO6390445.1 hypothetical protein [Aliihoeflea aestuarii]